MNKPDEIGVDDIAVHDRLRPVDPKKVDALAKSMGEIGLMTPIDVFLVDEWPHLIAGRHRVEAAKKLGWEMILANIRRDMDENDRLIWEADENLCRSELSPVEVVNHVKARKEAWDRKKKSGAICATLTGRGNTGFAAETAEQTGQHKSTINRALSRADVPEEIRALLLNTPLDKGTYLDGLVRLLRDDPKMDLAQHVKDDLAALKRTEEDKAAREREKQRKKAAKEAAKRARIELCDWLLDTFTPAQWDHFIALMDAAGGSLKSKELREWQAPSEAA